MTQEEALHSLEIERLQATPREAIAIKKLRLLIEAYRSGELSAADLLMFTNIDPNQIDSWEG